MHTQLYRLQAREHPDDEGGEHARQHDVPNHRKGALIEVHGEPRGHGHGQIDTEDSAANPVDRLGHVDARPEQHAVQHQARLHEEGQSPKPSVAHGKAPALPQPPPKHQRAEELGDIGGIGIGEHERRGVPHGRPEVHLAHKGQVAGKAHEQAYGSSASEMLLEPEAQPRDRVSQMFHRLPLPFSLPPMKPQKADKRQRQIGSLSSFPERWVSGIG